MPYIKIPKDWDIPEREATPEPVYLNRRKFLATLGLAALQSRGIQSWGQSPAASLYPAQRNAKYKLDRPITNEFHASHYNNFYEFTERKNVFEYVSRFKTEPWTVKISGEVHKPQTFDLRKLVRQIPLEERLYRHRCVEAWAMAVPWTGFPFRALLDLVEPKSSAKYVRMISFYNPSQAPNQKGPDHSDPLSHSTQSYPWPYYEALTIDEAMNELAFLVTGMYGHELHKQNGAPLRLAVPWKYGFKSAKSIVRIELVSRKPGTFWNDYAPVGNDWFANVNPAVPHPEWSQATETIIDSRKVVPTQLYNGYGQFVAHLYKT
ncbi:MAG: protein-methionine-sulfoxide reductase catalytic subunit MsrP [Acidobacteria bacterium]|nr:protein-methionine-sulfoxide reductase catalytic subunit MsrP [Acidobacteriota bacterium]